MIARSRFIQVVAGVLAAVLLVLPAGTSFALCLSAEPGTTHGGTSNDTPASTATVVVSPSAHHCPGKVIDVDTDPAVQSEVRTASRVLNDAPGQVSGFGTSLVRPPSRSSVQSRAPPPPLRLTGAHISLQSTVLLV